MTDRKIPRAHQWPAAFDHIMANGRVSHVVITQRIGRQQAYCVGQIALISGRSTKSAFRTFARIHAISITTRWSVQDLVQEWITRAYAREGLADPAHEKMRRATLKAMG